LKQHSGICQMKVTSCAGIPHLASVTDSTKTEH